MPLENLEEEGLPKNPDLRIAQLRFLLSLPEHRGDAAVRDELMAAVRDNKSWNGSRQEANRGLPPTSPSGGWRCRDWPRCKPPSSKRLGFAKPFSKLYMAPYYEALCRSLDWQMDMDLLNKMKKANEEELKRLDEELEDAEKNLGESEIRDAMMAKAEYLCRIGDKEGALTAFRKTYDKTVALGHRLDIVFYLLRIGLFYMDNDLITRNTEKAKSLIEEGGDWDRRNRLKVYQGLYCVAIRDFKQAAELFLDTVSTFTSYELMDYKTFVTYTVYVSMIALERPDLREKVIKGAEILEVLHSLPAVRQYLFSLYECRYSVFFQSLAVVEQEMKKDWLFAPHYRYYVREMRIHAYSQLLESYRSLTLGYMAEAFGVGVEFIDQELSRFIAAGRLHCKIDKVNEIVETNRPDSKNWQYQETIKKGDLLLNRVQKLSRVINM
ncbi:PREDICTED: 26S proteasome non-ATPase regulatory subunit 6 isoform X2 [Ceratotherium simum simum]|uniref:26S proteasome non-ATPase regulatory subunit 6 n=1 Tax=Ceratotherium simum simum TaxID=73337 RepID=A0ABM0H5F8_CERSS|nr:PREDICTED: 26S proteasome non-ATPase regulatory subunit 6 isoform X2 [Ceratotherium simum simum]